ncbi:hypothetical protein [Luteimonas kalidii]|uniref:Molybdopterin-binding protein n=1 Tax=Luteimonas kalidii TaxID=3042025 RepID=A0ABT6JY46_9GAMM|nr:hypothetical protein [Luteimonas kalidii]MDH5835608.1 hypothetical protein [Luteimonas kalidii]
MARRLHPHRPRLAVLASAALAWQSAIAGPQPQDPALRASLPGPTQIASPVSVQLDANVLAGLPRESVNARVHDATLRCEGVALITLLRATGAVPEERLDRAHLLRYVLADARDGDRSLFSLAELDPDTGGRAAFVVDRCDGKALDPDTGPLQLLVPGDTRAARALSRLDALTVVVAP